MNDGLCRMDEAGALPGRVSRTGTGGGRRIERSEEHVNHLRNTAQALQVSSSQRTIHGGLEPSLFYITAKYCKFKERLKEDIPI